MLDDSDEKHSEPSVRLVEIERHADSCGFHLTRGRWDPYPWIKTVEERSPSSEAGVRPGDCLLEVNGEDVVGKRVSEIARLVKAKSNVTLLLWNAGNGNTCSPEDLCCGPMPINLQRLSACVSTILAYLECPVCLETTSPSAYQCENGHLICTRCRSRSERCPVCRVRFERARSLLADQVYNSITDAFELRNVSTELRSARMRRIFGAGERRVPGIKVTPAHTGRFLARLVGKSSSAENLSSEAGLGGSRLKSLSSYEISGPGGVAISRAGSESRLGRAEFRTASCHGSTESLNEFRADRPDGVLYHCPYERDCSVLVKGSSIIKHFQSIHDGPLTQYYKNKIKIPFGRTQQTSLINVGENLFFLKISTDNPSKTFADTRIWMWLLGNKKQAAEYQLHVNFQDRDDGENLLSVSSNVHSLNSVSWIEIKETKKSIYLSSQTLAAICTEHTVLSVEISKCDYQN